MPIAGGMLIRRAPGPTLSAFSLARRFPGIRVPAATLLAVALSSAAGCASLGSRPMNYETCATSRTCVVRGVAAARLAEHASTAQFNLPDGRCINVSLPRERLELLRRNGPIEMTVTGEVYRDPSVAGEDAVLQINGRTIGFGLCGDFFVFVPDRQR
jgi:hypothetical protein